MSNQPPPMDPLLDTPSLLGCCPTTNGGMSGVMLDAKSGAAATRPTTMTAGDNDCTSR